MSVSVKRNILLNSGFSGALKKIYPQDMKLEYRRAILKLVKVYEPEVKEILELAQQYSKSEDGTRQVNEFLETSCEMPELPAALLDEESLNLSAQDSFFLEYVVK